MSAKLFIGTAGWGIPKAHASSFPEGCSSLSRYATVFNAAEINSTFYRAHRPATLERWRDSVPEDFRFSVKVPKAITHEQRLVDAGPALISFFTSLSALGNRLGPLLLQLPPKLAFDPSSVEALLREAANEAALTQLVFEPRHPSWFCGDADRLLATFNAVRAGADPERGLNALIPGGAGHLRYVRLHGSPRVYFSSYADGFIAELAAAFTATPSPAWCIFDNTASGAAAGDALRLLGLTPQVARVTRCGFAIEDEHSAARQHAG